MDVAELKDHLFDLSPIEKRRLQTGQELPSAYYEAMKAAGHGPTADGVYHLSVRPGSLRMTSGHADDTVCGRIDASPLQDHMLVKKASRFYHEPFATCDAVSIRYVYSGRSVMRTLSNELPLVEGDLCLLSGRFALSQYLGNKDDLVFTLIFDQESMLRGIVEPVRESNVIARICTSHIMQARSPQNYVLFHGASNAHVKPIMERLLCEYADPDEYSRDMVNALVTQLVLQMLRCSYEVDATPEGARDTNIANMLHYVDTHYTDVSLHDLAMRFGYNHKYVSRLFKRATGQTLTAYVAHKRMDQAASLLTSTNLTVKEVAGRCGLQNMTHFYRQFSAAHRCTPQEYRAANKVG